jgi:hypothetical protein
MAVGKPVVLSPIHGVVVGSEEKGIGGGQVEDAIIREVTRDDRHRIR